ncbi:MAG TPA: alpha-2-macroglobulin family protein [Flavisolibacter sp.]|nr:alpha-2-macroglobulin family protein [Flavisolibacter sp.]
MKSLTCFLLFCFLTVLTPLWGQVKNYSAQWKKVDELANTKNLPLSALAEVKKIYALAKKENQDVQVVKALVYIMTLQRQNREDNEKQVVAELEKELTGAKEPVSSLLKSLLADAYMNYFEQHRWQLYGQTRTAEFRKEDIATWSAADFHQKIGQLYLASIRQKDQLTSLRLSDFDAIIDKGSLRHLRPTLYDLLAHRALQYFSGTERDLQRPAVVFEIDAAEAFAPAAMFAAYRFSTSDTLSLQHKALLVYQELLALHLSDQQPDALIDVDIDRLAFVYERSVLENKDSLYKAALEHIIKRYPKNPEIKGAQHLLATWHYNRGERYNPLTDTNYRYEKIIARTILEEAVRDSSIKNSGWVSSWNLLQSINAESYDFELEKVNLPGQPFRALVRYTNIDSLHFRILRLSPALEQRLEENSENLWSVLSSLQPVRYWAQALPATGDAQQHSTEVKVDGLPAGRYYLLASPSIHFNQRKETLGAGLFHISNISYIARKQDFFVLHRQTGQPLSNAAVTVYKRIYDQKSGRYRSAEPESRKTDTRGYFHLGHKQMANHNGFYFDVIYDKDTLSLKDPFYHYEYSRAPRKATEAENKIFYFLDRGIFRPGQTVFFKGIVVTRAGKENGIAEGFKTTIYLRNANYKLVDSIAVTTNEYGSFHGKFVLPQTGLTGAFQLTDKDNRNMVAFSVEEYKRPRFQVTFENPREAYGLNDTVSIKGTARAYAGNMTSGAKVIYRVVRQPRFIYPWLFYRSRPPFYESAEIAHGETVTGSDGGFVISFKTLPDKKIEEALKPIFNYIVYADVTDINGETRSGSHSLSAGYTSLLLQLRLPEKAKADSLREIRLTTKNLSGEFQRAQVSLTVHRLLPEQRLIRKRYWQAPDQFVMDKGTFLTYFPLDEYKNETDIKTWPVGQKVLDRKDSSKANGSFELGNDRLSPGYYQVTVTTLDKNGLEVKDIGFMEIYSQENRELNRPEYLWARAFESPLEPGEKGTVLLGTAARDVFVIGQKGKKNAQGISGNEGGSDINEPGAYEFFKLDKEKKVLSYTATEADRGGYPVGFAFVKDNRFYHFGDMVSVPWTNKELSVEYLSFRDKTMPGSEEKWKVKISGHSNEKLAAEMLASMYDASLDQFRMHSWTRPPVWNSHSPYAPFDGRRNFEAAAATESYVVDRRYREVKDKYDLLFPNWLRVGGDLRRGEISYGFVSAQTRTMNAPAFRQRVEESKGLPYIQDDAVSSVETTGAAIEKKAEGVADSFDNTGNDATFQPRRNFNETAFFFPELRTDEQGVISFSFTAPEALTTWKLQTFAHTRNLAFGLSERELITQKELMVQPSMPRFLRQGDRLEITAKIVNLSAGELTGQVQLELFDAETNQSVDGWFLNTFPNQYFTVGAGQNEVVKFPVQVPFQFNKALTWRIIARSGSYGDGEENTMPVVSNKTLVTETVPISVKGKGRAQFSFDKLLRSGNSETLQHHSLTVEYTSNPAWYAVQALPYLMEYPHDCAEQIWNRYYANALASSIANSSPRIKRVFEEWKTLDTAALQSNLQKNSDLKTALLEETPWVLQASSETERKKNIALLFDLLRMNSEMEGNYARLKQMQGSGGGFVWFQGGPDDRYITQYILTGIGHLKKLGVNITQLRSIVSEALPYLDKKLKQDYDNLLKSKVNRNLQQVGQLQVQYLYMRSFFPELPLPSAIKPAYDYYYKQVEQYGVKLGIYQQAMGALTLFRTGNKKTAEAILRSLKENSVSNELGRYWQQNGFGRSWFWYQAPIETQALMIEAFSEITKDESIVDELRNWLLRHKQTNNWRTTKATAEACYALLLHGRDWLTDQPEVEISLGPVGITSKNRKTEAGTGYFRQTLPAQQLRPEMGNISVTVTSNESSGKASTNWGAVYWQYFEDLDKIETATGPLSVSKKLFIEKNTGSGPVLLPLEENTALKPGDKIKVRIVLKTDRDMEYVHMKDMRASALEPVNVLSGYKWQGGLGYYESTRDLATHFFFNYLRRGTYVFEYALFVTHNGSFSNGITTIQSMYAPEFSAHSEGVRISVEE